jgi:hypothetical protein
MADTFGSLIFEINANVNQLLAESKKAKEALYQIGKESDDLESKLSSFAKKAAISLAAAFSIKQIKEFAEESLKLGEALSDGAKKAGIQAGAFSQMAYAARISNVDISDLSMAFKAMQVNIAKGGKEFSQFGVDLKDLSAMDPDKQFRVLAEAVARIEEPAKRAEAAVALFGKQGANLLPLLTEGAQGIRKLQDEAVRLNIALSDKQIQSLADAQDAIDRLQFRWESFAASLTSKVAGAIEAVANSFSNLGKQAEDPIEIISDRIAELQKQIDERTTKRSRGTVTRDLSELQEAPERVGRGGQAANASAMLQDQQALMKARDKMLADIDEQAKKQRIDETPLAEIDMSSLPKKSKYDPALAEWERQQREPFGKKEDTQLQNDESQIFSDMAAEQQKRFDTEFEAKRTAAAKSFELLRESSMSEVELEQERHNERLEQLRVARESAIGLGTEYDKIEEDLKKKHEDKVSELTNKGEAERRKFAAMSAKDKTKDVLGYMTDLTSGIAQENKAAFELNKAAGIASAIINAYEGISLTLSKYPYPYNIGLAALHGAAAFAQVNAIAGQTFGGGGGRAAPSLAGSTPATPVTPVTSGGGAGGSEVRGGTSLLVLQGLNRADMFDGATVRELALRISEFSRDGGRVQVA